MSEVKRWYIGVYDGEAQARVCAPHQHEFIRDTEGEIFVLAEQFDACEARNRSLQRDLNQRDEQIATLDLQREAHLRNSQVAERRVGVLEQEVERLNRVKLALNELAERRADNCSVYRQHLSDALTMAEKIRDASLGMQRKYLGDLIVHLYQNSGAALKPAEGSNTTTCTWSSLEYSWQSSCGMDGWEFTDGGTPAENGMHFCHSCGNRLLVEDKVDE